MSSLQTLADAASLFSNDTSKRSTKAVYDITPINNAVDIAETKPKGLLNNASIADANNNNSSSSKTKECLPTTPINTKLNEKLLRRREQIAAASRKSRERRKQEFLNLKKENTLLWEHVDQLNNRLQKYGASVPCNDQLKMLRKKRSSDDSTKGSTSSDEDDEIDNDSSVDEKGKTSNKRQKIGESINAGDKSTATTQAMQLPVLLPHTPSSISVVESPVTALSIANLSDPSKLSQSKEGTELTTANSAFDLDFSLCSNVDKQKLLPLIKLSELRANWFLQHFKSDLLLAYGENLSGDEKTAISNLTIHLSRSTSIPATITAMSSSSSPSATFSSSMVQI